MTNRNTILGKAIRQAREAEGVTQLELSKMLNCSQAYINQSEAGSIGYLKFAEILNLLGYTFTIQLTKVEKVHLQD